MPFTPSEPTAYKAALAGGTVRLALALRIVTLDGLEIALTTFTRAVTLNAFTVTFTNGGNITIPSATYRAGIWMAPSDLEQKADVSQVNNWELTALLGTYLTAADIAKKRFTGARWSLVEFIWDTPSLMLLRGRGFVGEVEDAGQRAVFKMRGLEHLLQQEILPVTSPLSRARWGDAELNFFNLNGNTDDGYAARVNTTVDAVATGYERRRFTLGATTGFPSGRFTDGTVRFTSGANAGLSLAILEWNSATGVVTLCEDAPYAIAVGNGIRAQIAPPKTLAQWRTWFGSGFGFNGEPEITTMEQAGEVKSA